jgi:DNA-binding transcriptional ArsR family regulator
LKGGSFDLLDKEKASILEIVSNPVRRTILELLSINESATYSLLSSELNLKAGSVYHHINSLSTGGLLEQKADKSYALTMKGKQAVEYLRLLDDPTSMYRKEVSSVSYSSSSLSPVIRYFTSHPLRSLLEIGFLFVVAVALGSEIDVGVFGTFLVPLQDESLIFNVFLAILGWFSILAVCEAALFLFYKVRVDKHLNLIAGISASLIGPTIVLIGLYLVVNHLGVETINVEIAILVEGILQLWMVLTISAGINETTKASFSQSLVIALFLNYILLVALFLLIL